MEGQFKHFLLALSKSRGVEQLQSNLPLQEVNLAQISQSLQRRILLEKYLKSALLRCDCQSKKKTVLTLTQRINFQLQRIGEKRVQV